MSRYKVEFTCDHETEGECTGSCEVVTDSESRAIHDFFEYMSTKLGVSNIEIIKVELIK